MELHNSSRGILRASEGADGDRWTKQATRRKYVPQRFQVICKTYVMTINEV